jgi:hypothetical protein
MRIQELTNQKKSPPQASKSSKKLESALELSTSTNLLMMRCAQIFEPATREGVSQSIFSY